MSRRWWRYPRADSGWGAFRVETVRDNQQPVHEVRVEAFELSKTEVTFEEYDRFTAATDG